MKVGKIIDPMKRIGINKMLNRHNNLIPKISKPTNNKIRARITIYVVLTLIEIIMAIMIIVTKTVTDEEN